MSRLLFWQYPLKLKKKKKKRIINLKLGIINFKMKLINIEIRSNSSGGTVFTQRPNRPGPRAPGMLGASGID